ncbi:MAG: GAF domain-containing protein [Phycisphaerales bacterium]
MPTAISSPAPPVREVLDVPCMADGLPRLLLVTGPTTGSVLPGVAPNAPGGGTPSPSSQTLAPSLLQALGTLFHVETTTPDKVAERLQQGRFDLVISAGADFLTLARALATGRDRLLLNALGEGVCLTDYDGRVLWHNDRFAQYDGPTQHRIAAACRQAARQNVDPSHGDQNVGGLAGGGRRYEVSGSDDQRVLEVAISRADNLGGEGVAGAAGGKAMVAVAWDVTAARRTQQKAAAIDRAGEELVRLDAELVRTMHTPERIRVLEQKIVKIAHDLLAFDQFNIRLIDHRTGKLELVMSKGLPPDAMEVSLYAKPDGNGISGYVAATGRSYISYDTTTDPRYVSGIHDARSSLTVPLRLNDKVIGIFNVENTRPAAFNEEDRQFAEKFANHAALALHILDLLRVERVETSETVSHTVEDELSAPLAELAADAAKLKATAEADPGQAMRAIDRIIAEVEALKRHGQRRHQRPANHPRRQRGPQRLHARPRHGRQTRPRRRRRSPHPPGHPRRPFRPRRRGHRLRERHRRHRRSAGRSAGRWWCLSGFRARRPRLRRRRPRLRRPRQRHPPPRQDRLRDLRRGPQALRRPPRHPDDRLRLRPAPLDRASQPGRPAVRALQAVPG